MQFPFRLCWGFWSCLPPSFFGLSCCWGLNKDDRSVGRNQFLLEKARGKSSFCSETPTLFENECCDEHVFLSPMFFAQNWVLQTHRGPTFYSGACMRKCMNMQSIWWTCPSRGDIWSSLLYDETRILILAQTLQWKFSEWRSFCHPQVLNSRYFKKGSP